MVGIFTILYLFSVCVSVVLCQGVGEKVCVCVCVHIFQFFVAMMTLRKLLSFRNGNGEP